MGGAEWGAAPISSEGKTGKEHGVEEKVRGALSAGCRSLREAQPAGSRGKEAGATQEKQDGDDDA